MSNLNHLTDSKPSLHSINRLGFLSKKSHAPTIINVSEVEKEDQEEVITKPLEHFRIFSTLPIELRRKIWRHMFPSKRRLIAFYITIHMDQSYRISGEKTTPPAPARRYRTPITLRISHESREETLLHYGLLLHSSTGKVKDSQIIMHTNRASSVIEPPIVLEHIQYLVGNGFCNYINFKEDKLLLDVEYLQESPIGHKWLVEVCGGLNRATVAKIENVQVTVSQDFKNRYGRAKGYCQGAGEVFSHFVGLKQVYVVPKILTYMGEVVARDDVMTRNICEDLENALRKCAETNSVFKMPMVISVRPGEE